MVDLFSNTLKTLNLFFFVLRSAASNELPDALQKVDIPVISTQECNDRMASVSGALCDDSQIAVYDAAEAKGSCNVSQLIY